MRTTVITPISLPIIGGLADDPHLGPKNSVAAAVGVDLFSEPGLIKANQKLQFESQAVTQEVVKMWKSDTGNLLTFIFTKFGQIWTRNNDDPALYNHLATSSSSATFKILDAVAHKESGYMYLMSRTHIDRVPLSTIESWTSPTYNWTAFATASDYHPSILFDGYIYIGSNDMIYQINTSGTVSVALYLPKGFTVRSLGRVGYDLLIGGSFAGNYKETFIYQWNRQSTSFNHPYPLNEPFVTAFMNTEFGTYCFAGTKGNRYVLTASGWQRDECLPYDGFVFPNAIAYVAGNPIFGYSNLLTGSVITDTPLHGVYSFGRRDANYNPISYLAYPVWGFDSQIEDQADTSFITNKIQITAIEQLNEDQFIVAWNDVRSGSSVRNISVLSLYEKCDGAYVESMVQEVDGINLSTFGKAHISYTSIPANTDITLQFKQNYADYVTYPSLVRDAKRFLFTSDKQFQAMTMQYKVVLNTNGNSTPIFKKLFIPVT